MLIYDPDLKKTVHEYDVTFENGMTIPVIVDVDAGDTYRETNDHLLVFLAPKPSKTDKTKILPAENIKIFKSKILVIQDRDREINQLTPEQQAVWEKTLEDLGRPN